MLAATPKRPSENGEFLTCLRPRSSEMRIGSAYDVLKQMVATCLGQLPAHPGRGKHILP